MSEYLYSSFATTCNSEKLDQNHLLSNFRIFILNPTQKKFIHILWEHSKQRKSGKFELDFVERVVDKLLTINDWYYLVKMYGAALMEDDISFKTADRTSVV